MEPEAVQITDDMAATPATKARRRPSKAAPARKAAPRRATKQKAARPAPKKARIGGKQPRAKGGSRKGQIAVPLAKYERADLVSYVAQWNKAHPEQPITLVEAVRSAMRKAGVIRPLAA